MPFIDGLRAVAVASIVLFHAKVPGTAAGYLGVDIFFTISGFLILGIVYRRLETGSFSAMEFLARRCLRILPPLILALLATCLAALLFPLTPTEWKDLTKSASRAAGFVVNFYFQDRVGYFDTAAETKPLLHLWSLSVEEQFYLLVALLGVFAMLFQRRRKTKAARLFLVVCAIGTVSSLLLFVAGSSFEDGKAFYLTPFRAWQFLLGGAAAYAVVRGVAPPKIEWLGLATLSLALAGLGPPEIFASGGTALILAGCAHRESILSRALSVAPMQGLGLVSYSFYLWHWPAIFFARTLNFGEAVLLSDLTATFAAFVFAILTYFVIERPMHRLRAGPVPARRPRTAIAVCLAALAAPAGSLALLQPRVGADYAEVRRAGHDLAEWSIAGFKGSRTTDAEPEILVYGDSHAEDLSAWAKATSDVTGIPIGIVARAGCAPLLNGRNGSDGDVKFQRECAQAKEAVKAAEARHVIVVAHWPIYLDAAGRWAFQAGQDRLAAAVELLRGDLLFHTSQGRSVVLLAPLPIFPVSVPDCIYRSTLIAGSDPVERCSTSRLNFEKARRTPLELLKRASQGLDRVRIADPSTRFCSDKGCSPFIQGVAAYRDTHHLNPVGSTALTDVLAPDIDWLRAQ